MSCADCKQTSEKQCEYCRYVFCTTCMTAHKCIYKEIALTEMANQKNKKKIAEMKKELDTHLNQIK